MIRFIRALAVSVLVLGTSILAITPADAVTTEQTEMCHDGFGNEWQGRALWSGTYTDSAGVRRARIDYAGWTLWIPTGDDWALSTDSAVRTYDRTGLIQTLKRTAHVDYFDTDYVVRNPLNPRSAPGVTRVTVTVGQDGDGYGDCIVTFYQPL